MSVPSGTVTFLFTDIEGSTRLWEEHRASMGQALERHDRILRQAVAGSDGVVFSTGGDGLAAAFQRAPDALAAALRAQSALQAEAWDPPLAVRMAVHTGDVEERAGDYFGPPLNRCARLMALGHGGQVLCSGITASLVADQLPQGAALRDLGPHRLRDLSEPEHVFQLVHPVLRSEFSPLRSLESYRSNLSTQSTAFVGRDREVTEVAKALTEGRVVTLCGVGGVGKTRLALQVAAHVLPQFEDGAWVVELASVGAAEAVEATVAATLGIQPPPGRSLEQSILDYLRPKSLLLVLDNCEHLLSAVARFVDVGLASAPGLTVLATSREGLAVSGERLVTVPSLEVPDSHMQGADVLVTEAVRLFTERAREARSDFAASAEDAGTVGALCRRLDGIPLAIELAAARVRVMTPREILEHLDRRFKLLTAGRRTAVTRHQTLQSTLDWSYDLLEEVERLVFRRLAVFTGGFELTTAEAIAADDDVDSFQVADGLFRLVEKSLVVAQQQAGATRYRLLETIRDYAWNRLVDSGESEAVSGRHCHFYLTLAEEVERELCGPQEMTARTRMEADLDDFRAALRWAVDSGDSDTALRLVDAFWNAGSIRSPYGTLALEAARLAEAGGHPLAAVALGSAAAALSAQGEHQAAAALVEEALAALDTVTGSAEGNRARCHANSSLTMVPHVQADPERFLAFAWAWLAAAQELGDPFQVSQALNLLGSLIRDPEEALAACERSVSLARGLGSPSRIGYALVMLATRLTELDAERAEVCLAEALQAATTAGNEWLDSFAAQQLALLQAAKGEYRTAASTMLAVAERAHASGDHYAMSISLYQLSSVLALLERDELALVIRAWCEHNGATYSQTPSMLAIHSKLDGLWGNLSAVQVQGVVDKAAALRATDVLSRLRQEVDALGSGAAQVG